METKIEEVFPELLWIGDEHLRERVKSTFHLGIREGGIALENLKQMPYTASYNTRITYQAHVRLVTKLQLRCMMRVFLERKRRSSRE